MNVSGVGIAVIIVVLQCLPLWSFAMPPLARASSIDSLEHTHVLKGMEIYTAVAARKVGNQKPEIGRFFRNIYGVSLYNYVV